MTRSKGYRLLVIALASAIGILSAFDLAEAAPTGLAGCVSDWYVSYDGRSSYVLVHKDPDDLPLTDLYFSRSYNDPTDLSRGYLDFNRDGRSDVFSAVPIGGGEYRWRYSAPSVITTTWSDWINLAFDVTPPDQLRFGDFNGDGYTDVFSTRPRNDSALQWQVSFNGTQSYKDLAYDDTPLDQLRFGDFNGDGRTDVFALKPISNSPYLDWDVSLSGTESYVITNTATTPLSEMQFGDINGDGHTDVFTSLPSNSSPGEYDWVYSSAGLGAYQIIATRPQSVHDVLLAGNFDLDNSAGYSHGTDFFYTLPRFDGTNQWWYFHYKNPPPPNTGDTPLAYDATPPSQLRFGDFNGDGVTDIFTLKQDCTLNLPLVIH